MERLRGALGHVLLVEDAATRRFDAQEDVGVRPEVGNERELLIDDGNAAAQGVARRSEVDRCAVPADRARIGYVRARDQPQQRRLAGAVLTDDGVHGPGRDGEVDAVEGGDARVVLGDALQLEQAHGAAM